MNTTPEPSVAELHLPVPVQVEFRLLNGSGHRIDGSVALSRTVSERDHWFQLDPSRFYRLVAKAWGFENLVVERWRAPRRGGVVQLPLQESRVKPPAVVEVRGRVVDATGRPLGGVLVTQNVPFSYLSALNPHPIEIGLSAERLTVTGEDGVFSCSVLTRIVRLSRRGFADRFLRTAPDMGTVVLPTAGALRIQTAFAERWRTIDWRADLGFELEDGTLHWETRFVVSGRGRKEFQLDSVDDWPPTELPAEAAGLVAGLSPGRLRVRLRTSGYQVERVVRIRAGETSTVQIP